MIEKIQTDKTLILKINSNLDAAGSPELEKVVEEIDCEIIKHLNLDLTNTEYISSIGLRCILVAYKKMVNANGTFKLSNVNDQNMEILKMTGFAGKLTIE